jgi:hypothetical protein
MLILNCSLAMLRDFYIPTITEWSKSWQWNPLISDAHTNPNSCKGVGCYLESIAHALCFWSQCHTYLWTFKYLLRLMLWSRFFPPNWFTYETDPSNSSPFSNTTNQIVTVPAVLPTPDALFYCLSGVLSIALVLLGGLFIGLTLAYVQ